MADAIVTVGQLAYILKLSRVRIEQLAKKENMPCIGRSQYPMVECIHFYIDYLKRQVGADSDTMVKEKIKLYQQKAERALLENKKLQNKVIDVDTIQMQIMEMCSILRECLLAMPGQLCHVLEDKNATEIRQCLEDCIKQALNRLERDLNDKVLQSQDIHISSSVQSVSDSVVSGCGRVGEVQQNLA